MQNNSQSPNLSDALTFLPDHHPIKAENRETWKVLIVDDEPEVHTITKLALRDFQFESKKLEFLNAHSASDAREILGAHEDIALVLLDVVMETDQAGLELVHYIREELLNQLIRIVLRTGQPGQAPERQVITEYDINDYKAKTELTSQQLFTTIVSALRSYRDLVLIDQHRRELRELLKANARFVPGEFLNFLQKSSIVEVELGDQVQADMTVLFTDVRAFTTLSEQMTPEETFNFVNSLFITMGPIIRYYGGFVDKYMGDAIMALFPTSADAAIQASIKMRHKLVEFNLRRIMKQRLPIEMGIGIHTGKLMLGIVGETQRLESTVISDVVNVASRLEGLTKVYETPILLSEETLKQLSDPEQYLISFVDKVQVKGRTEAVSVFELRPNELDATIEINLNDVIG